MIIAAISAVVLLNFAGKFAFFVLVLENLKIGEAYEGFLFLAEATRNPPVLRPHRHEELELNLVAAGETTYVVGGRRYRFPKRSLLWFFPSQEHQLVDRSSDAAYYVAVFNPDLIRRACRSRRYAGLKRRHSPAEGVLHVDLDPDRFETLRREMRAATEEGIDPDLLNREAGFGVSKDFRFEHHAPDWLNAVLRHVLLHAWRLQEGPGRGGRAVTLHPAVRKALDLIERDAAEAPEDTGLDILAGRCAVSPSFLSRRFRAEVGVTLSRYRNSVRLGRFWEELRGAPRANLLEAVFAAGFGSYAQFYRVFKEAYGVNPRASVNGRHGKRCGS